MRRASGLLLAMSLVLLACTSTTDPQPLAQAATAPSSDGPPPPNAPGGAPSTHLRAEHAGGTGSLDDRYEACLHAAGFDPDGVQVLVDDGGAPWWVKTGHDVPAVLHGPCIEQIGGEPNGRSSHGVGSTG